MVCSSRANHASTNLKKFSSSKLDKFTLFTHSFVGWNLKNRYKESVSIFLRLRWHFKREKSVSVYFSGKVFYKSNRKLFSCVCIALYKHKRSWAKTHNSFFMALIKREILTSRKVLSTKSCTRNQFLFCKKCFAKYGFFSLNMSV